MSNRFELVKAGNLRGLVDAGLWDELPMPHKLYVVKKSAEQTRQAVHLFNSFVDALMRETPPELVRDETIVASKSVGQPKPDQNKVLDSAFPFHYFHKEPE